MVNIVLFGAPGSGKGTQAEKLIARYGINHISTGDIIRQEIKAGSALGREVQDFIAQGQLASDDLVNRIIANYLDTHQGGEGSIFDGYPRTIFQAESFDEMLSARGESVSLMIFLDVPDEELVQRILLRGKDSGRADDSDINVIENRIRVYKEQTAVVAGYYEAQGKYYSIPGVGTIDEIFDRIVSIIDSKFPGLSKA